MQYRNALFLALVDCAATLSSVNAEADSSVQIKVNSHGKTILDQHQKVSTDSYDLDLVSGDDEKIKKAVKNILTSKLTHKKAKDLEEDGDDDDDSEEEDAKKLKKHKKAKDAEDEGEGEDDDDSEEEDAKKKLMKHKKAKDAEDEGEDDDDDDSEEEDAKKKLKKHHKGLLDFAGSLADKIGDSIDNAVNKTGHAIDHALNKTGEALDDLVGSGSVDDSDVELELALEEDDSAWKKHKKHLKQTDGSDVELELDLDLELVEDSGSDSGGSDEDSSDEDALTSSSGSAASASAVFDEEDVTVKGLAMSTKNAKLGVQSMAVIGSVVGALVGVIVVALVVAVNRGRSLKNAPVDPAAVGDVTEESVKQVDENKDNKVENGEEEEQKLEDLM